MLFSKQLINCQVVETTWPVRECDFPTNFVQVQTHPCKKKCWLKCLTKLLK